MVPLFLLLCFALVNCDKTLLFSYSYTVAGTSYPTQKLVPWTYNTSSSLTPGGIRQQYVLGRELRHRLIDTERLLDDKHNPKQLQVHALMTDRAIESAYAQIAGLYPIGTGHTIPSHRVREKALPPNPYNFAEWIEDLGAGALNYTYQSMPLVLSGMPYDTLIDPENACLPLKDFATSRVKNWRSSLSGEKKELEDLLKLKDDYIQNITMLKEVRDLVLAGLVEGHYEIGFDKHEDVYKNTMKIDLSLTKALIDDLQSKTLVASPILRDVVNKFNATYYKDISHKLDKDSLKYVSLFGVDGKIIMAIITQLDSQLLVEHMPMPASILLFQLYKEMVQEDRSKQATTRYTVNVMYDNFNLELPELSLEDFIYLVGNNTYTEKQFDSRCILVNEPSSAVNWVLFVVISGIVVGVVAFGLLGKFIYSKLKEKTEDNEDEEKVLAEVQSKYSV